MTVPVTSVHHRLMQFGMFALHPVMLKLGLRVGGASPKILGLNNLIPHEG